MALVIAWRIHHVAYVENLNPLRQSNFSTARMRPEVPLLDEVEEVDAGGVGVPAGVGDDQPQVRSEERVLGLLAVPGLALQLDLLRLVLVVGLLQARLRVFARLDLLGELDFLLRGEQVVFTDGREVLADQIGREPPSFVRQLVSIAITPRLRYRHAEIALSSKNGSR